MSKQAEDDAPRARRSLADAVLAHVRNLTATHSRRRAIVSSVRREPADTRRLAELEKSLDEDLAALMDLARMMAAGAR